MFWFFRLRKEERRLSRTCLEKIDTKYLLSDILIAFFSPICEKKNSEKISPCGHVKADQHETFFFCFCTNFKSREKNVHPTRIYLKSTRRQFVYFRNSFEIEIEAWRFLCLTETRSFFFAALENVAKFNLKSILSISENVRVSFRASKKKERTSFASAGLSSFSAATKKTNKQFKQ